MTQSAKDEISGNLHEFKGTVKEKVGQALTAEGQNEKLTGKVQKKVVRLKRYWRNKE